MAVETLAAFRAAEQGRNIQPTILVAKRASDGELVIAETDATGAIPVLATLDKTGLATEDKQDDIIAAVDGVETLIGSTNTKLNTIAGYVDGVETLIGSTNTKLDTLHTDIATTVGGYIDGVETLIGTTNTNVAAVTTRLNEMGAGLITAKHDSLYPTFNATSDVWVYKLAAATVATLTINYVDATKAVITSIVRT